MYGRLKRKADRQTTPDGIRFLEIKCQTKGNRIKEKTVKWKTELIQYMGWVSAMKGSMDI